MTLLSNLDSINRSTALRAICGSHVHMTNNRLGIMVGTEIYLARLISDALVDVEIDAIVDATLSRFPL